MSENSTANGAALGRLTSTTTGKKYTVAPSANCSGCGNPPGESERFARA
jgi:hypothetical protein